MRKTLFILTGVAIVIFALILRLAFQQKDEHEEERKWFIQSLGYEFSARVDTVRVFNEHAGRVRCLLSSGNPLVSREDSLKSYFKEHDMLYFIFKRSADSITFILPEHIRQIEKGDCVRVSSSANRIQFFRGRNTLVDDSLTEMLTGFSRPFFLKKKS